jgi:methionine synthase II (cobalamin-independent)
MFATLAGGYPATDPGSRPDRPDDALVRAILAEQVEAGLGLLTDGSLRWPDHVDVLGRALLERDPGGPRRDGPLTVDAWVFAADAAGGVPVKQCLPGPYSLGRRFAAFEPERADLTLAFADVLAPELVDLAAAGCPFIQVDEDAAVSIGADPLERALFRDAPGPPPRRPRSGRGSAPPVPVDQRR